MITVDCLSRADDIAHAFFTRAGGVSEGIYASLNCGLGSNDDRAAVTRNRARAMEMLDRAPESLVTAYQVHGVDVATVREPWRPGEAPKVDAMVTDRPGVTLGILTADCAPVLFADHDAGVVGAAHAGWRGALAGVTRTTVERMEALGARRDRIAAAVGPCIGLASYEVGPEFRERFVAESGENAGFFIQAERAGHWRFDLAGFLARELERLGLAAVETVSADTCADEDRFFSYRRACLRGESDYARGLAAIAVSS